MDLNPISRSIEEWGRENGHKTLEDCTAFALNHFQKLIILNLVEHNYYYHLYVSKDFKLTNRK